MSIDLEDLDDQRPLDFRRANGAPMVMIDGKNERYSRPSGWGKELDDENALVNWKMDVSMRGVAMSRALQAKIIACKEEDKETRKELREEAIQTGRGNEASDTGTALHAMSERWEDPDDDFDPGDYLEDLEAYQAELDRLGLASDFTEVKMVNTGYRTAGTCDRIYRLTRDLTAPNGDVLKAGELIVGDLKTGKKLDFSLPGYCVQMALYAQGDFYDVSTDTFLPTPEINQRWGLLVHLPVGRGVCEMRWVDLELGNWGAWLVQQVREWRKNWKNGTHDAPLAESPATPTEQVVAAVEQEFGAVEEIDLHHSEWVDMMSPFAQRRIKAIGQHAKARQVLMQQWPVGVPTVRQGITDPQDMEQVLSLLDRIEKEFSIPFPGDDPRVVAGVHRSEMNITNTPPEKDTTT